MSSRNQYDSVESRRSPRDRSPAGRYNDARDDYRGGGGAMRGNERRRPSIPEARVNHNAFPSNRNNFRDPISRESSRDFPPRDPPRGPKGLIDAPTGPRSNIYGSPDYRPDFGGGFRGDFRGRGRARGRGWRDDSRDRGREAERDYRDRRDDRPPTREPFRNDDRGRGPDRWEQDSFRGRRPSPPPARGRSPGYGARDTRDAPTPDLLDRRSSRDGPVAAAPSAAPDTPSPFVRGYGRVRASRGRGRGFYDEYRQPGRSRSPDPGYRRTRPSATPPPQVPAFGSTTNNGANPAGVPPASIPTTPSAGGPVAIPTAPRAAAAPSAISSAPIEPASMTQIPTAPRSASGNAAPTAPVPIAPAASMVSPIPTAPRSYLNTGRPTAHRPTPMPMAVDSSAPRSAGPLPTPTMKGLPEQQARPRSSDQPQKPFLMDRQHVVSPTFPPESSKSQALLTREQPKFEPASKTPVFKEQTNDISLIAARRRAPIYGRRKGREKTTSLPEVPDEASDSDSGDFDDTYFDGEIAKKEAMITNMSTTNPLPMPKPIKSVAFFLEPFASSDVEKLLEGHVEDCIAPVAKETPTRDSPVPSSNLAPKAKGRGKSRPVSPLPEANAKMGQESVAKPNLASAEYPRNLGVPHKEPQSANGHHGPSIIVPPASTNKARDIPDQVVGPKSPGHTANGLNAGEGSKPETEEERQAALASVRKMMTTPPISGLPKFNCEPWHKDNAFVASLEVRNLAIEEQIRKKLRDSREKAEREQREEGERYRERYLTYRRWTDFSNDPIATRSREKFAASRAKTEADAAAPPVSAGTPGGKPESSLRRAGSRFATEHDMERVLRQSEQEARETKEREERVARAKSASAKEATIPAMIWTKEEFENTIFVDRTHLVPFERSFARLEFAEPIDNFTEEESEIFEKVYVEHPKQWTTIAEALPKRDYKACIQHYYKVKHSSKLKEKFKKQSKKRGRGKNAKGLKPKSNALMADLRDEGEDGQDTENGGETKRRPRRAAAPTWPIEAPQSESEVASPAPPGRKAAALPKGDGTSEPAPPKRGRGKGTRDKGAAKQAKTNQILAAAPIAAVNRQAEPPANPAVSADFNINSRVPVGVAQFPPQYDGAAAGPRPFAPTYISPERPITAMPSNFEPAQQMYRPQERLGSAPPSNFDPQQDRRNTPQKSSYWSSSEATDFPALLKHFGTDWHGIAKFMTTKTHIMVKNYYQRHLEAGKKDWLEFAAEADEKRSRGESTGPLPQPPVPQQKRRYEPTSAPAPRPGSALDGLDDAASGIQVPTMTQASPQAVLSTRFPALAQAGPVQHQPVVPPSNLVKQMTPQPIQQAPPQVQQQQRPPRGPPLGFFNTDRPPLDKISQRSHQAAQEAQLEQSNAWRLEREQRELRELQQREQQQRELQQRELQQRELQQREMQQREQQQREQHQREQQQREQQQREQQQREQQQQAMQRERQFQLKQENETPNPHQYEPYSTPSNHHAASLLLPQQRMEAQQAPPVGVDNRRTAPPAQAFQPRSHQTVRNLLGESIGGNREIKSSPSPAAPRAPMSAPPQTHEGYSAPPQPPHALQQQHVHQPQPTQQAQQQPPPPPAPARQQETVRKTSNLMALLNNDEPSDPRPAPAKHISDVSASSMQRPQTPPSQHPLQPSRYVSHSSHLSHSSQPTSQPQHSISQQLGTQAAPQQHAPGRHNYPPPPPHPIHQHTSSVEHTRSYTPTGFETRPYAPPSMQPTQQQQQMYSHTSRQSIGSQPPSVRREPPLGDVHGSAANYARQSAPTQPSMRMKETSYAATPPTVAQSGRQGGGSPLDVAQADRDFYARPQPQQYLMPQQQQPAVTSSPQLGPAYHSVQHQQGPHRHLAFGQSQPHTASPPTSYAPHRPVQRSRQSSFDGGRFPMTASSAPTSGQHGFPQAAQQQQQQHPSHMSKQYQQAHPSRERHDYEAQRERERRLQQQEEYERERRLQEEGYQRRMDEHRR